MMEGLASLFWGSSSLSAPSSSFTENAPSLVACGIFSILLNTPAAFSGGVWRARVLVAVSLRTLRLEIATLIPLVGGEIGRIIAESS